MSNTIFDYICNNCDTNQKLEISLVSQSSTDSISIVIQSGQTNGLEIKLCAETRTDEPNEIRFFSFSRRIRFHINLSIMHEVMERRPRSMWLAGLRANNLRLIYLSLFCSLSDHACAREIGEQCISTWLTKTGSVNERESSLNLLVSIYTITSLLLIQSFTKALRHLLTYVLE